MCRKLWIMAISATALALVGHVGRGAAQQIQVPKAGAEHKAFDPLMGTFTAKVKIIADPSMPPTEMDGIMTRKWILDGLFFQEDFIGKLLGVDFKGMGIMGYDAQKKKYVGTWIDTMDTGIATMEGTYDPATKTFNLVTLTEEVDPATGKKTKSRGTVRVVNDDHHMQEMFRTPEGGKEMKVMEIHYNRVKK